MILLYILLLLHQIAGSESVDTGRYLVSLKLTETIEKFKEYDNSYPLSQHINPLIDHAFEIGKYSGFSGNFTKEAILRLKRCPLVADITPDIVVNAFEDQVHEQLNSPRHLARLSQRENDISPPYNYCYSNDGDVLAYVIDSGINISHPEFDGRAEEGIDLTGEGPGDFNGHGTHVAGLIGSNTYGSSKNVKLVEVKALNQLGSGSLSSIISAIEFAVNHREESGLPGVANLSLGSLRNNVLNRAVNAAAETGLVIVVAAGNSNSNACMTSPASAQRVITVGALDDSDDSLPNFTNWGECVDVFASGVNVSSVNFQDERTPMSLSGTSMAAPIVAGLAANLLSSGISPYDIQKTIRNMAVKNRIPRSSLIFRFRTPNRIAYNGSEDACSSI